MVELSPSAVAISVIVPTYRPGAGIWRVIDSLDAQTLPVEDFDVILIDDGSPDDTYETLREIARERPNYRVERIENSGWPSRPRNIATRMARGEYVLYMDHDDSLYPGALQAAVEYARRVDADILNVKEMKTNDPWWCMGALREGNAADLKKDHRIDRMLPMVPHKVYRRQFILDHDITYPEGRRMLWEDIYFNVQAYAEAERVAVLADAPFYVWHSSSSNNSKTYGPLDTEFWDRLDDLMAFIDVTLAEPALALERREMLMHQYRSRVLRRLGKALQKATPDQMSAATARARAVQSRYIPEAWDDSLGPWYSTRAKALRANRPDLVALLHATMGQLSARTSSTDVDWEGGVLRIVTKTVWRDATGEPLLLERRGDRLGVPLPREVLPVLPDLWLDLTESMRECVLEIGVRSRDDHVMWELPVTQRLVLTEKDDGRVGFVIEGRTLFDPATAAMGRAVAPAVWDLRPVARWSGMSRAGGLPTMTRAKAVLVSGRAGIAYRSKKGLLSVDLMQRLRSIVSDGGAVVGPLERRVDGYRVELPSVSVVGDTEIPFDILTFPSSRRATPTGLLHARLVGSEGRAWAVIEGDVAVGTQHRLMFWSGGGMLTSRHVLVRTHDALELREAPPAAQEPMPAPAAVTEQPMRHDQVSAERVAPGARPRRRSALRGLRRLLRRRHRPKGQ